MGYAARSRAAYGRNVCCAWHAIARRVIDDGTVPIPASGSAVGESGPAVGELQLSLLCCVATINDTVAVMGVAEAKWSVGAVRGACRRRRGTRHTFRCP